MNKPHEISMKEWKQIMRIPTIRKSWGLEDETPEQFADMVYGVRFDYYGGPGYNGDLYILHGDVMGEPITVIRRNGRLVLA